MKTAQVVVGVEPTTAATDDDKDSGSIETAIVMFAISVTISEIFTFEMFMTLIFRMGQGQM